MGRKPKRHRTWANSFGRKAMAAETSGDSEECDVPSESVEPSWLVSYLAGLDGKRAAKEMGRDAYLLQEQDTGASLVSLPVASTIATTTAIQSRLLGTA